MISVFVHAFFLIDYPHLEDPQSLHVKHPS